MPTNRLSGEIPGENKHSTANGVVRAFFTGLALSFLIFIPFIIRDGGRFLFYGDFNVQQVAFYRLAHDAVRSGNLGWSHLTDLGANFIGSYSFYLLGSPFFWLTIPFPSEWLQYLMGPLLILKFACATMTGYIYVRRYLRSERVAIMTAVLYAFSGFSIYNIFFNHFHEAIVFFPLMLTAMDEFVLNKRRGLFALAVAACCIVNYYFFVGMVMFSLLYFVVRMISGSWKVSVKEFFVAVLEACLGVGMAAILLFPSVLAVMQNSRVSNPINGWGALVYSNVQRYIHIIECFFFIPDLPARPNFTPDSESKWASLGAWLPLFGTTGVIGWLQLRRKHWLKKMLYCCFIAAFIPVLNSAFQLFNASYYARWYYMLTLMMALATGMSLESDKVNWKRSIKWTAGITIAIIVGIGLTPSITTDDDGNSVLNFGLEKYPTRFWTYAAVSLLCIALVAFLFFFCKKNQKIMMRTANALLCCVVVVYSIYFIGLGKSQSLDPYEHLIPYALNGGEDLPFDTESLDSVRSDFYESTDNSGMFWEIPTIQCFHSIVPGSVMQFYDFIGVERDVASRPDTTHYALRGLTSVKWLFDDESDGDDFSTDYSEENAQMPGWIFYGTANGFDIWENEYYIPMGFSYEYYITYSEAEKLSESERELVMLKALIVPDDQVSLVSDLLSPLYVDSVEFTEEAYEQDCLDRAKTTCDTFTYTNTGFSASISSDTERIIFFSVPSEDGWSATVNGEPAEIITANVGFMAVRIPKGDDVKIEFTYKTPGLSAGIFVTAICVMLFILYLVLVRSYKKKEEEYLKENPKQERKPVFRVGKFSDYILENDLSFSKRINNKYVQFKRTVDILAELESLKKEAEFESAMETVNEVAQQASQSSESVEKTLEQTADQSLDEVTDDNLQETTFENIEENNTDE
jgi:hypothetical protein